MTPSVVDGELACPGCGFVYDTAQPELAATAIETGARAMVELLLHHPTPRSRPAPAIWSALEYAAHTRDVLLVQRERLLLALRGDNVPVVATMGRDERVVHDGYADQRVDDVAAELTVAAGMTTRLLRRFSRAEWLREVDYNYPEPARRSLAWLAVHTRHEIVHHLRDVGGRPEQSSPPP